MAQATPTGSAPLYLTGGHKSNWKQFLKYPKALTHKAFENIMQM